MRKNEAGGKATSHLEKDLVINAMEVTRSKKHVYFNQRIPQGIDVAELSQPALKFVGYLVYRMGNCENFKRHGWVPIPRDTLQSLLGVHYAAAVREVAGLVEVYEKKAGVQYSKGAGLCKKYRFVPALSADVRRGRFTVIPMNHARIFADGKPKRETGSSVEPIIEKLIRAYDGVTLSDAWQNEKYLDDCGNSARRGMPLNAFFGNWTWASQVAKGRITATRGDSGRLFHPLIMMARELRPFVRYEGEEIRMIDVKAAHPFFLARFADCGDVERWLTLCRADVYAPFVGLSVSRDDVKAAFQVAISPTKHGRGKLAESILELIGREAPSIHAWLGGKWARGESAQLELQKLESEIFVVRGFNELPFWSLPMHDGLAVQTRNLDAAHDHLAAVAEETLGFKLILEKL